MKVYELIEMLEGLDEDMEVMIAEQPNYPFEYSIAGLAEYDGKLYIVEGYQKGYVSKEIWDETYC